VGVQEVRCDKEGTVRAEAHIFLSMEKETKIINWEQVMLHNTEEDQQLIEHSLFVIG
jgi:hypothetical protein